MATFQVYKDRSDEFRWRFRSTNGRIIADSAEGYSAKRDCLNGIDIVKREAPNAEIDDQT